MKQHMGQTDRTIRGVIGVVVILLGVAGNSWWGAIGLVPLLTSLTGFCPLYTLLGISTCGSCNTVDKPGKTGARLS